MNNWDHIETLLEKKTLMNKHWNSEVSEFDRMKPDEYAALWGCGRMYDSLPNLPGDGTLFYNYAVDGLNALRVQPNGHTLGKDLQSCVEFYTQFVPAIERTIQKVTQQPENFEGYDLNDLNNLLAHVISEQLLAIAANNLLKA